MSGVIERKFDSVEAWMVGRLGNIGGSSVKDIVNLRDGETKTGLWRAAAESIIGTAAIAEADLSKQQVLDRGHALEKDAIKRYEQETGRKVRQGLYIWSRPDDLRMTVSPDGAVGKIGAVESKALLSPAHLEVLFTGQIPREYHYQKLQYFLTNSALRWLDFIFYHPDFPRGLDFLVIRVTRKEVQKEVDKLLIAERAATAKIREIVNAVTLHNPQAVQSVEKVNEELLAPGV